MYSICCKRWCIRLSAIILLLLITLTPISGYAYTDAQYLSELVESYYIGEIPAEFYTKLSSPEMVNSLNDSYSKYFTAEEFKEFIQSINMNFQGIGVYIEQVPEGILITSVIDESGALDAGLIEGDIITSVNGRSLQGVSQEEAISLIKGEEDTLVQLQIKRKDVYFDTQVKRETIHIPTVQGGLLDNKVAYIIVNSFGEDTNTEFSNTLKMLNEKDPVGFIIDVQGNPGGFLQSAVDLIGYFASGKTALSSRNKYDNVTVYTATKQDVQINKPVILLTNGYSASASEILAAAFKDYNAGIIIGEKTFGKGTVQNLYMLPDGGAVKLTVEQFFSPLGKPINKLGITPDLLSGDTDPIRIASLLFGQAGNPKRGYMQLSLNGNTYAINLLEARKAENWGAYAQIIDTYTNKKADLKMGTSFGWRGINQENFSKPWKFYYPEYTELPALTNVSSDKEFTIAFRGAITRSFLDNNPVELIHSITGERIPLTMNVTKNNSLKAIPNEPLVAGETYYLVIHTGLASNNKHRGSIVTVTVAP